MTISTTSDLYNPRDGERVPSTTLTYLRTRNKMKLFNLVVEEFERSGISQAELAARLGKGPDRISRLLGAPGNWEADTISDLLFAISGAVLKYELSYPLKMPRQHPQESEGHDTAGEQPPIDVAQAIQGNTFQPPSGSGAPDSVRRIYSDPRSIGSQKLAA